MVGAKLSTEVTVSSMTERLEREIRTAHTEVLGQGKGQWMGRLQRPWLSAWWTVTECLGGEDLERYWLGSYASAPLQLATGLGSRARELGE